MRGAMLPFTSTRQWAYRWEQTRRGGRVLHRIERGTKVDGEDPEHFWVGVRDGRTVCGLKGGFVMPGIFSRMGAPRCRRCCERLGLPAGDGAPYNQKLAEPKRLMPRTRAAPKRVKAGA